MELSKRKIQANYEHTIYSDQGHASSSKDSEDETSTHSTNPKIIEFKYNGLLLWLLIPSLLVMFGFGARPTLIAACFGGIIVYILDLLGTLEGTIMAIFVTLFAIWATLVWASRLLLQESFLYFALVGIMALILFYVFIVFASHFKLLVQEFDSMFYYFEGFIFATLPLLSSCILSWFLCVEISSFDLPTCFTFCYFAYTLILCKPMKSSSPEMQHIGRHNSFVLNMPVILCVYAIPIIMSPVLHAATAHNVLFSSSTHIIEFVVSLLWPIVLMLFCAQRHYEYWSAENMRESSATIGAALQITSIALFACLQTNPVFEDLKSFAGLAEPLSSGAVIGIAASLSIALYIRRSSDKLITEQPEFSSELIYASAAEKGILVAFVSVCIGVAALLAGIMLRLPAVVIMITVGGAMALADFYQRPWAGGPSGVQWTGVLLLALASSTAFLVAVCFAKETLYYMEFTLYFHQEWTMQQFCTMFSLLVSSSILLPSLAYGAGADAGIAWFVAGDDSSKFSLPGASYSDAPSLMPTANAQAFKSVKSGFFGVVSCSIFSVGFPLIAVVSAGAEVMIREQDWQDVNVDRVDAVYPVILLLITAALFIGTSYHLYRINISSLWSSWTVMVIQGCKLLHLLDVTSLQLSAWILLILALTLPFILQLNVDSEDDPDYASMVPLEGLFLPTSVPQLLLYLILSFLSIVWAHKYISATVLTYILTAAPTKIQQVAGCATLFFGHAMVLLVVLRNDSVRIRSFVFGVFLISITIATEAFGSVSVGYDPSSTTQLVVSLNPDMMTTDRSGFFTVLATMLALSAAFDLVPIRSPVPRLLFALAFSYSSGRALLSWAFPLTLSLDSPTHGLLELPSVYCFLSSLLSTSTTLHSSQSITSSSGGWMFIATISLTVACLFWSLLQGTLLENALGIIWAAAVTNSCIAIATRAADLIREVNDANSTAGAGTREPRRANTVAASVAVIASFLGIMWVCAGAILSPTIYSDLAIPASTLLMLCTRRGMILGDYHPIALSGILSTAYLVLSALYSIFIMRATDTFFITPSTWYEDGIVSIWSASSSWLPWLTLVLMLVPLPAIVLGILRRKDETEELMFLLAILSLAAAIGAQIMSVRLLGVMGLGFGMWGVAAAGSSHLQSNRLI